MIDAAIRKARAIPRSEALKRVDQPSQPHERPVFAVTWDPRLPSLSKTQLKHWRSMKSQDKYLGEVFKDPPLIAYKRQRNIGDFLIRAKVPPIPNLRPIRDQKGMKKCGKCIICPFVLEGKHIKEDTFKWIITYKADCNTENIVYQIQCNKEKCKLKYIGETKHSIKNRMSDHIGYVRTKKLDKATGGHFNQPGHSISNMKVTMLEKMKTPDILYRKEREKVLIRKFNTFYHGINKQP